MKLAKMQSEKRATALKAHAGSEQRFRYPAHEEISEVSCSEGQCWNENDQPADADGPVRAIAS